MLWYLSCVNNGSFSFYVLIQSWTHNEDAAALCAFYVFMVQHQSQFKRLLFWRQCFHMSLLFIPSTNTQTGLSDQDVRDRAYRHKYRAL